MWSTDRIAAELETHAAETWRQVRGKRPAEVQAVYPALHSTSVDFGLMEKTAGIVCLPIGYLWSDVGSWPALEEVLPTDAEGNHVGGGAQLLSKAATGNVVYGDKDHVIALLGVQDLVVVQTPDATLVCSKQRAQEIRDLVERLASERPELL
ncbi:MAG: hypothetical protein R3F17_06625 [Planctomycetota bacterium]